MKKRILPNETRFEIIIEEEVGGMYGFIYKKGDRITFDYETEDAYIIVAGHGQINVIPKTKARKIKITKVCQEIEEVQ